ncbi:MAG: DUF3656 domain-containing protein, partial [Candidatus Gastranaerophilales bacterium]|nr:DUF3656 domain-containing protein [Candidatus Gastranaerophilales bacterium]
VEIYSDKITAKYNDFQTCVSTENMEPAKNPEKMKENFIKSFQKSGGEIFYAENISFLCGDIPFMTFSVLNSKRRELFHKLEEISVYKRSEYKRKGYAEYISLPNDYRLNIHNKKASEFYEKCGILNQMPSVESSLSFKNKELMRTKYCIRKSLNMCLKSANTNKENLFLVDETGKKFPLKFDCNLCEMAVICP